MVCLEMAKGEKKVLLPFDGWTIKERVDPVTLCFPPQPSRSYVAFMICGLRGCDTARSCTHNPVYQMPFQLKRAWARMVDALLSVATLSVSSKGAEARPTRV